MNIIKIFKIAVFFIFLQSSTFAEIIKSKGSYKHIGDVSQRQACKLAEQRAKEKAIKEALGLSLSLDEIQKCKETDGVFECEENQVSVLSLKGEITEYKIVNKEEGLDELSDPKIYFCSISIEAVVKEAYKKDDSFDFEVKLNNLNYRNGEKLNIYFVLSDELHLNIFQYFPYKKNEKIIKLFPNKFEKNNKVKQGKFKLPTRNLSYIVEFPKNIERSKVDEHLIFIASKSNIKWLDSYFSIEDLNKRLIEIGKNNIVRKEQKTYTILK